MARRIVVWSPRARADLRAVNRETALDILLAVDRYLDTGAGDVIKLQPPRTEFRLRLGDYRVLFRRVDEHTIEVRRVRNQEKPTGDSCLVVNPRIARHRAAATCSTAAGSRRAGRG